VLCCFVKKIVRPTSGHLWSRQMQVIGDLMLQFAEAFRDQFTEERLDFMNEIEDGIRNSVDERYKKGQGPSGKSNSRELCPILTGYVVFQVLQSVLQQKLWVPSMRSIPRNLPSDVLLCGCFSYFVAIRSLFDFQVTQSGND
jgi:hypothetical protein